MNHTGLVGSQHEAFLTSAPHTPQRSQNVALAQPVPPSFFSKPRNRRTLIWGLTSTALSAIGLIGLAMFEQYNGMLSELRGDLKHFNETCSEYVKKDKLQKCWQVLRESTKEIGAANVAREKIEQELMLNERSREQAVKEIQQLRERLAYLEGMRSARPAGFAASSSQTPEASEEIILPRPSKTPPPLAPSKIEMP